MKPVGRGLASIGALLMVGLVLSACSNDNGTTSSGPSGTTAPSGATVPQINATDFTADFSVMEQLTGLAAQGTGLIGVLLPDTTTSTRYVQYDEPLLSKAFEAAGLT